MAEGLVGGHRFAVDASLMHATISESSGSAAAADPEEHSPAVTVRTSLASKDHIISIIDGKPYETLRRHLSTHGLTPEEYRARYHLKPNYPMVAPAYSEARRAMAKKTGLCNKGRAAKAAAPASAPAPKRTPRSKSV